MLKNPRIFVTIDHVAARTGWSVNESEQYDEVMGYMAAAGNNMDLPEDADRYWRQV